MIQILLMLSSFSSESLAAIPKLASQEKIQMTIKLANYLANEVRDPTQSTFIRLTGIRQVSKTHQVTFGFNVGFMEGLVDHHPSSKYCPEFNNTAGPKQKNLSWQKGEWYCHWAISEPLKTIFNDGIRDIRILYPFSYNMLNDGNWVNGKAIFPNHLPNEDVLAALPDRIAYGLSLVKEFNVLMTLNNFPFNLKLSTDDPYNKSCNKALSDGCFSKLPSDVYPLDFYKSKSCCPYPGHNEYWNYSCGQIENHQSVIPAIYEKLLSDVATEISGGNPDLPVDTSSCTTLCQWIKSSKIQPQDQSCKNSFTYRCFVKYLYWDAIDHKNYQGPHWNQYTNSFFPDYFSNVQCLSGGSRNYFSLNRYRSFLGSLAKKLTANPSQKLSWEIGNEVDCPTYFWGTAFQFLQLAEASVSELKTYASPDQIFVGGYTVDMIPQTGNPSFSKAFASTARITPALQENRAALSFHIYPGPSSNYVTQPSSAPYEYEYSYPELTSKIQTEWNPDYSPSNRVQVNGRAIITEYNVHANACGYFDSTTIPCDHNNPMWNYINSPFFVYELAKLLEFTAQNGIKMVYLYTLFDNPFNAGPQLGFFELDGRPRESYRSFKDVYDIVKNGYVASHFCGSGNQFTAGSECAAGESQYLELTEAKTSGPRKVLRVALTNGVPRNLANLGRTCRIIKAANASGFECEPNPNLEFFSPLNRGSWQIYDL